MAGSQKGNKAIFLAILTPGSAQNPHVLRVRSGFSALAVVKLAATITPYLPSMTAKCLYFHQFS
ncbi:hypothetical protein BK797_00015 [Kosakonia sacchari]|nr:hypothetical protein BK797_00015 [Kosakonia sacchari]